MQEVERVNENKKTWNGVDNVNWYGLPHIVFVPNGHMHFNGDHGVFGLAHTS
jgi:hypothetical protein